jgi:hypothetical protein
MTNSCHFFRAFLLDAVRVLREQGAVWVYLLEESERQQQSRIPRNSAEHAPQPQPQNPGAISVTVNPDFEYDSCGERVSAGSSGIASGNSSSIPWNEVNDFEGGSSSSSGSSTKRGVLTAGKKSPQQRCLVELTPEHRRTMAAGVGIKNQNVTPSRRGKAGNKMNKTSSFDGNEDLIQKVSELNVSSKKKSSPSSSSGKFSMMSSTLGMLIRDRLATEGIRLGDHPFNSKVGQCQLLYIIAKQDTLKCLIQGTDWDLSICKG